MIAWLTENAATLAVVLVLALVVALVVRKLVLDRRAGRTSCGCGCANCPSQGICHKPEAK